MAYWSKVPLLAPALRPGHKGKRWDVEQVERSDFKPRHCSCCIDSGLHVTRGTRWGTFGD